MLTVLLPRQEERLVLTKIWPTELAEVHGQYLIIIARQEATKAMVMLPLEPAVTEVDPRLPTIVAVDPPHQAHLPIEALEVELKAVALTEALEVELKVVEVIEALATMAEVTDRVLLQVALVDHIGLQDQAADAAVEVLDQVAGLQDLLVVVEQDLQEAVEADNNPKNFSTNLFLKL